MPPQEANYEEVKLEPEKTISEKVKLNPRKRKIIHRNTYRFHTSLYIEIL